MDVSLYAEQFVLHTCTSNSIEGAEWFVHQENCGISRQRACQPYTLLLPTRELTWEARAIFVGWQANQL